MKWPGFAFAAAAALGHSCIDGSRKMASQRFSCSELVTLVGILDALFLSSIVLGSASSRSISTLFRHTDIQFLGILVSSAGIKVVAGFLYQRALHVSPLSVTVPYLAFTPVLLVFTSFFMMNERPSSQGLMGVVVVTLGGYFLAVESAGEAEVKKSKPSKPKVLNSFFVPTLPKWLTSAFRSHEKDLWFGGGHSSQQETADGEGDNEHEKNGSVSSTSLPIVAVKGFRCSFSEWISLSHVLDPILALRKEEGSLLMLIVAGLLSVSNSMDKMGAHLAPSSIIFAASQKIVMAIPLVIFLGITSPGSFKQLFQQFPSLAAISFFEVMAFICYLKSLETLLVSYSIAAKRSNVLISVIIGRLVFKERIWKRIPFVLLMVGGMAMIVFA